jgi:hypothetical protein
VLGLRRWPLEPPDGDLFDNDWRHDVPYHGYLEQPMANVIRENVRQVRKGLATTIVAILEPVGNRPWEREFAPYALAPPPATAYRTDHGRPRKLPPSPFG